ncbi:hypothetical protein BJ170DRAFT_304814 [Xylariales sp. AK1849]|nr:hypothetical protein BJ170DRAFT_304814 [Xylariales sp. AK1849]
MLTTYDSKPSPTYVGSSAALLTTWTCNTSFLGGQVLCFDTMHWCRSAAAIEFCLELSQYLYSHSCVSVRQMRFDAKPRTARISLSTSRVPCPLSGIFTAERHGCRRFLRQKQNSAVIPMSCMIPSPTSTMSPMAVMPNWRMFWSLQWSRLAAYDDLQAWKRIIADKVERDLLEVSQGRGVYLNYIETILVVIGRAEIVSLEPVLTRAVPCYSDAYTG